jgi:hypothetical protein
MIRKLIPENIISKFLNMIILDNNFIFINLWSFVHLATGFLLFKYITQNPINLILLLLAYEVIEFALWGIAFRPEKLIDVIWDILFAIIGIGIAYMVA